MEKIVRITVVSSVMMLLLAACGSTGSVVKSSSLEGLKAATSRSVNCPADKINISDAEGTSSWTAVACNKTYRCVGIDVADELAECNVKTKSLSSGGATYSSAAYSDY
jgi:hypothetical protein